MFLLLQLLLMDMLVERPSNSAIWSADRQIQ